MEWGEIRGRTSGVFEEVEDVTEVEEALQEAHAIDEGSLTGRRSLERGFERGLERSIIDTLLLLLLLLYCTVLCCAMLGLG